MSVKQSELEERTRSKPWPIKEPEEYAHIYSAVTGGRYDDIVDMVKKIGGRWSADGTKVIDEFGDVYSEKKFREVMEVTSYG